MTTAADRQAFLLGLPLLETDDPILGAGEASPASRSASADAGETETPTVKEASLPALPSVEPAADVGEESDGAAAASAPPSDGTGRLEAETAGGAFLMADAVDVEAPAPAADAGDGPAVTGPAPQPDANGSSVTSVSVAKSGDQRIDGILGGTKWSGSTITYSDPNAAGDYQSGYDSDDDEDGTSAQNEGFSQLSAQELLAVHYALNSVNYTQPVGSAGFSVEGFTGLTIDYNGAGSGTATIRIANSSDPATSYAYRPANNVYGGDVFIGTSARTPTAGNYSWHTMLHEIGHALGLKHGHETGGNGALPDNVNSIEYSIMTYDDYIGQPDGAGATYETWGGAQTFMMLDIAALQYMYGANYSINSGNTTYSWNQTSGETYVNGNIAIDPGGNRIFATIWDGGGVDTYDLSNYTTDLDIDLGAGDYSTFSAAQRANLGGGPNGGFARGNIFNALMYQGNTASLIENAVGGIGNDTIDGNQAANRLTGNGGNDRLYGLEGGDTLLGGAGNDSFDGGSGNDSLDGGADADTLEGGSGADTLKGGDGNDLVYWSSVDVDYQDGGSGTDTISSDANYASGAKFDLAAGTYTYPAGSFTETWASFENYSNISGTGDEAVIGSSAANYVWTGSGDNLLQGAAGNDTLKGGGGNDTLEGGTGIDSLLGGDGNDIVKWEDGSVDYQDGGGDSDTILAEVSFGSGATFDLGAGTYNNGASFTETWANFENYNGSAGTGRETVIGSSAANYVWTGSGANLIRGAGGNDTLKGGGGADTLEGGTGNDSLLGGAGNDVVKWEDGTDYHDGGDDIDTILTDVSFGFGATFDLGAGTYNNGASFTETWTNFENYTGTGTGAETVIGSGAANLITGGSGGNTFSGAGGDDTIEGGGGNDTINGGSGIDVLSGGDGNDTFLVVSGWTGGAGESIDGGAGTDTFDVTGISVTSTSINLTGGTFNYAPGGTGTIALTSIENVVSGGSADTIVGSAVANTLSSFGGNDNLNGRDGNDVLNGGTGNDTLIGGLGKDSLSGGTGDDRFTFTTTADSANGAATRDVILDWDAGDVVYLTAIDANETLAGNQDFVFAGMGGSVATGQVKYYQSGGNTYIVGNTDADATAEFQIQINGLHTISTNDLLGVASASLTGGGGADDLYGTTANDTLSGAAGNDTLTGGLGKDSLSGGGGADVFVFLTPADSAPGAGRDIIADWDASDVISLAAIDADEVTGGDQNFTFGGLGASVASGQVKYYQSGGNTYVVGNTDADAAAEFQIQITGLHTLTAADFLL